MKGTKKRLVSIMIALIMLIASVFVYSYFVKDEYQQVKYSRGVLLSKSQDLIYYENTVNKVESFMSQINSNEDVKGKVSLMLPGEAKTGYFTNQIIELARINGITIEALSLKLNPLMPSDNSAVSDIGSMTASVKANGTYAGLKSFVRQINNNLLIMNINELNADHQLTSNDSKLNYTMSITSYYQSASN